MRAGDKNIVKIQDRGIIFQHVVMGTPCDDLREEKVGVPVHLLFSRIAGPADIRDFENWCQKEYKAPLIPFLPYGPYSVVHIF